jgi:hypothetical protein
MPEIEGGLHTYKAECMSDMEDESSHKAKRMTDMEDGSSDKTAPLPTPSPSKSLQICARSVLFRKML